MPSCSEPSFDNKSMQETVVHVGVSNDEAIAICLKTLNQSGSESWYQEQSNRITASLFGKIINGRQSMYPASTIKLILEKPKKHCSLLPPLKWGIESESVALQDYKKMYIQESVDVINCGLVVNPKLPWLGCTIFQKYTFFVLLFIQLTTISKLILSSTDLRHVNDAVREYQIQIDSILELQCVVQNSSIAKRITYNFFSFFPLIK